jgi:ketosteroid isomerase-like protein
MKKGFLILFLVAAYYSNAQKNMEGLVNAERSFSAYSVSHGTKEAFLKFLDSNGVVFEQGKAVNGIAAWNKRENRPASLKWWPGFAEIASSNEFGYTTGPWELYGGTKKDSVVARGNYTTVWHIDNKGEWKFLVDLGVSNTPKYLAIGLTKIKAKKLTGQAVTNELLKAEEAFIAIYKTDKAKAYKTYLSKQSILNRNGLYYPAIKDKSRSERIENTPSAIEFTITGSGIAASGDLAYVYGNTLINTKAENYLHIWRREKDGWKIALEVLRY